MYYECESDLVCMYTYRLPFLLSPYVWLLGRGAYPLGILAQGEQVCSPYEGRKEGRNAFWNNHVQSIHYFLDQKMQLCVPCELFPFERPITMPYHKLIYTVSFKLTKQFVVWHAGRKEDVEIPFSMTNLSFRSKGRSKSSLISVRKIISLLPSCSSVFIKSIF